MWHVQAVGHGAVPPHDVGRDRAQLLHLPVRHELSGNKYVLFLGESNKIFTSCYMLHLPMTDTVLPMALHCNVIRNTALRSIICSSPWDISMYQGYGQKNRQFHMN